MRGERRQIVKKGFTLVELLIVIAIIGLLSTMAVTSLGGARSKARDARRLSDVKQVQTALGLYNIDQGIYPTQASETPIGNKCLDSTAAGFVTTCGTTVYMKKVPTDPQISTGMAYTYKSAASQTDYELTYKLEKGTTEVSIGIHTATSAGIQ